MFVGDRTPHPTSPPLPLNSLVIVVVVTATNGHFRACNPIMELSCSF